jgi:hypothetical protein
VSRSNVGCLLLLVVIGSGVDAYEHMLDSRVLTRYVVLSVLYLGIQDCGIISFFSFLHIITYRACYL